MPVSLAASPILNILKFSLDPVAPTGCTLSDMNAKNLSGTDDAQARWTAPLVGSAAILALLSASCCVLPIALSILGLGGAWLSFLGPFVQYRPPILIVVFAVVGWGWFWSLTRHSTRLSFVLLVFATLSLAAAMTAPQWERPVSQALWTYWGMTR
jgi:mercuric ion transport protein